jgi:hypothetical protein
MVKAKFSLFAEQAISRMRPPNAMHIICIDVTNKCDLACSNCTRLLENQDAFWDMTLENFRLALRSLKQYPGVIAMIGGNPCMHPKFEALCQIFVEEIPERFRRGLWTNNFFKHKALAEQVFGVFNLNTHGDERAVKSMQSMRGRSWYHEGHSEHSPILTAMKDLYDEETMWRLIPECDINLNWSAAIVENKGELRYYFCEVAAAFDLARGEDHGFPLKDNWWMDGIKTYAEQIVNFCPGCGVPAKIQGPLDSDETDMYTTTNETIALRGRKKRGKVIKIHSLDDVSQLAHRVTEYSNWLQGQPHE